MSIKVFDKSGVEIFPSKFESCKAAIRFLGVHTTDNEVRKLIQEKFGATKSLILSARTISTARGVIKDEMPETEIRVPIPKRGLCPTCREVTTHVKASVSGQIDCMVCGTCIELGPGVVDNHAYIKVIRSAAFKLFRERMARVKPANVPTLLEQDNFKEWQFAWDLYQGGFEDACEWGNA